MSEALPTVSYTHLKICDEEPLLLPKGIRLWQDTGFIGHKPDGVEICMPKKKPKGKELTCCLLYTSIMKRNNSTEFRKLWTDNKFNRGPLVSIVLVKILICTIIMTVSYTHLVISPITILLFFTKISFYIDIAV